MFVVSKVVFLVAIIWSYITRPIPSQGVLYAIQKSITLKTILFLIAGFGIDASFLASPQRFTDLESLFERLGYLTGSILITVIAWKLVAKYISPLIQRATVNSSQSIESSGNISVHKNDNLSFLNQIGIILLGLPILIIITAIAIKSAFTSGFTGGALLRMGYMLLNQL